MAWWNSVVCSKLHLALFFFFWDVGKLSKIYTLPETNSSSHLKMDGLKTIVSFWDGLFSGDMLVSGRVNEDSAGIFTFKSWSSSCMSF